MSLTSLAFNTISDASGPVEGAVIIARLRPVSGFRVDDAIEVPSEVRGVTNAAGYYALTLERNGNITPANTYWEIEERIPRTRGGTKTHAIVVGNTDANVASSGIITVSEQLEKTALTLEAADIRYLRSPISGSNNVWTGKNLFKSGWPWIDVRAFDAVGDGVADDTAELQAAIDFASSTGALLYFSPGTYKISGNLTLTSKNDITFWLSPATKIVQSSTTLAAFVITSCLRFTLIGGRIEGPGKGSVSGTNCNAITLQGSSRFHISTTYITGFYNGIRPNSTSTNGSLHKVYIDECAFTGYFIHTGDSVNQCEFRNIGTTNLHHGIYGDEAIAGGVRCTNNHYEGIAGAAVHLFSLTAIQYGMSFENETFLNNYGGYLFGTFDQHNINVSGAVIKGCTDRGLVVFGQVYASKFEAVIENSTGRNIDIANDGTNQPANCEFNIISRGGAGCYIGADFCSGSINAQSSTGDGVRFTNATGNLFRIVAKGSATAGLRLNLSDRNVIWVLSGGNTQEGVLLYPAGTDDNTISGNTYGNTGANLTDSGSGNRVTELRVA